MKGSSEFRGHYTDLLIFICPGTNCETIRKQKVLMLG